MQSYGVIGGTIWGNRGAEAMVVTTMGRVRQRDPDAAFVIFSYYPDQDRELVDDDRITIADVRPKAILLTWITALVAATVAVVGIRMPERFLTTAGRELRDCRALFDVSGISFHDGRLPVVGYNLLCLWPAILLRVPVVRLSQAMGPFEHLLNRLPARWVTSRALHTFARGRVTAEHMASLGVSDERWSTAPDVAFAYLPEFSVSEESAREVDAVRSSLEQVAADGRDIVGLVPSSLVAQKMEQSGDDYLGLLTRLIVDLQRDGRHVLVMPNATRAASTAARNNDLVVVRELAGRLAPAGPIDSSKVTIVDFDLHTASIRELTALCSVIVTSRFHAMVAALALGVPPLVMGWSHKYTEVLEVFDCAELAVDFSEAERRVPAMVAQLMDDRDAVRERIQAALPGVVEESIAQFDQVDRL